MPEQCVLLGDEGTHSTRIMLVNPDSTYTEAKPQAAVAKNPDCREWRVGAMLRPA
jgi:hypothetical protein